MGHTRPDWSTYGKLETVFALVDLGELAVRLGSIDTFDRAGNVIWMEDFERGRNNWETAVVGSGSAVVLTSEVAKSGEYALKLTAGAATDRYAVVARGYPFRIQGKHGVELSLAMVATAPVLTVRLENYDGTTLGYASLRYTPSTGTLAILTGATTWTTIAAGINLYVGKYGFHTLKLVVDWANLKYVRLLLNHLVYDLSAHSVPSTTSATASFELVQVTVQPEVAATGVVYIDDVIVTINED